MVTKYSGIPHDCGTEMAIPDEQASARGDYFETRCAACDRRHGFERQDGG